MQAAVFEIKGRTKRGDLSVATLDDFCLGPRGITDAAIILERPQVTLYCLDDEHRQAVFVETLASVDLARHPFYYLAQYENAERVLVIPYELLHRLATQSQNLGLNLILIYSVGRCGSTLVSRALGRLDGVYSLSEPDVYAQIATFRPSDGSRDRELTQLLRSCTYLLNRSDTHRRDTLALKFRSFSIAIGDLFYAAFPRAKALFLYRNAETWARSFARAFHVAGHIPCTADLSEFEATSPAVALAMIWLAVMDRYWELHAQGVPMLAVRYETLTSFPVPSLGTILEYCGLPADQVSLAEMAFGEDSQEGTSLSRDRVQASVFELTSDHCSQMRKVLQAHPRIQHPDFILPNTVMAGAAASDAPPMLRAAPARSDRSASDTPPPPGAKSPR